MRSSKSWGRGSGVRNLLAGAALVSWACAKATPPEGGEVPEPRAGSGGKAGSSAQSGSGGTSATASGGSGGSGASGGSGTGGSGGTSGAGATGGDGGVAGSAGSSGNASGGVPGTGGAAAGGNAGDAGMNTTGGNATGGIGAGGNASGGVANAGAGGAPGGMGGGGIPNDPNWMPPDMSAAKIVVFYKCDQRQPMGSSVAMTLYLKNQTDEAYDLSDVTVRYWMSSEPPPRPERYHSASNLSAAVPVFVPNMAVSYLEWSFGATGTLPVYVDENTLNNNGVIQSGIQSNLGVAQFNQANDWSFDPAAMAAKENPKITVYDGDTLIWGCEPSRVCAEIEPEPMGEAGASSESKL
jgi:hypothetical protein